MPPPVNGQANCNAVVQQRLSGAVRLSTLSLGRSRVGKVGRAIANSWLLLNDTRRGDTVYVSLPGQRGTWLLTLPVIAAQLRGLTISFHHHSFPPINCGVMKTMRLLVALAGLRQRHILLSDGMRDRFASLYLPGGCVHDVDAFLMATALPAPNLRPSGRAPTLGHMSVLTRD